MIGPYKVERKLATGGMGTVYLAKRDDQIKRTVAVKLVNRGMDSEGIVRRFHNERQILANLSHPNIAQLYDGGEMADGRPYFAMEYVEGETIDQYCENRKLSIQQRLLLFRKVCAAVSFAHQNLVIHRDLKPGNIMVSATGEPKLLDFGIAGLLDPDTLSPNTQAHTSQFLSFRYASPEQVRGERLTVASDIYSLGVLFYETLTGSPPFDFQEKSPLDIFQLICEQSPEKPSHAFVRSNVNPPDLGGKRTNRLRKERAHLSKDLDLIALKALEKNPCDRYHSVEQFSDDIARHLDGLPITACTPTLAYRASRFVRRNKWRLLAASGVVLSLLIFAITVTWQRQQTALERNLAQRERETALKITDFLTETLEAQDPERASEEAGSVEKMLDKSARKISQELEAQPEIRERLTRVIGRVYKSRGLYKSAEPLLREALAMQKRLYGQESVEALAGLRDLASLFSMMGYFEDAEPLVVEALDICRRGFSPQHPELAHSLNDMGNFFSNRGDFSAAEPLLREAIAIYRLQGDQFNSDLASTLNELAVLSRRKGDYQAADALFREALAMRRALFGNRHLQTAKSMRNLAFLLRARGDYAAAESFLRKVYAIYREQYGEKHSATIDCLSGLARLSRQLENYEKAESLYRNALAIRQEIYGPYHYKVANSLNGLGLALMEAGDDRAAEPLLEQALVMRSALRGRRHFHTAYTMHNLGVLLMERGNLQRAEMLLGRALDIGQKVWGDSPHPSKGLFLANMAELMAATGRFAEGEALARRALEILERKLVAGHRDIFLAESALGGCLLGQGSFERAEERLLRARRHLVDRGGKPWPYAERTLRNLLGLYEGWGKPEEARQCRVALVALEASRKSSIHQGSKR